MNESKSIYRSSKSNVHAGIVVLSALIIGVTIYLTNHYFSVHFPEGLGTGSLCDINGFFNCDAATHSKASAIFGVPISVFGMLMGIFILSGYLFRNDKWEGTIHFISLLNLIGCIGLFIFSLVSLGSLCPFCTVYYILSLLVFLLFHKFGVDKKPHWQVLLPFTVIALIASGITLYAKESKKSDLDRIGKDLIAQFDSYQKLPLPKLLSPHRIASATPNFEDAAIQLSIFSDFQCPACKMLASMVPHIAKRYRGNINIMYYFYPLDNSCNAKMTRALHPFACQAAYLANCTKEKFTEVHDHIFENQGELSFEWLNKYAATLGVTECMNKPENKQQVVDMLNMGEELNVQSTPTIFLNGVKIDGALPLNQFYILMDELLSRHDKNKK